MSVTKSTSTSTSTTTAPAPLEALSNQFRLYPNEAIVHLRSSSLALLSIFIFTNLLPLPTPLAAWHVVFTPAKGGESLIWWIFSCAELAGVVTLIINILQSVYAFKYPRTPVPSTPVSKSNKALVTPSTNPKSKRKLGGLSPHTSPQPQRSFSSSYASSPLSTPSRTLNYTAPSPSSPYNLSMNSSFGSSIGTTSSVAGAGSPLAAYRGKHADRVGRALDGSFLAGLASGDDLDGNE